jgi:hypothetical protein
MRRKMIGMIGMIGMVLLVACGAPTAESTSQPVSPEPTAKQQVMVVTQLVTVVTTATSAPASPTTQATDAPAVTALPTEAPTVAVTAGPTALPSPTLPPTPTPYQADWTKEQWGTPPGWHISGNSLLNDGKSEVVYTMAPVPPPSGDYAIEAEIEVIPNSCIGGGSFGLIARSTYVAGYTACTIAGIARVDLKGNKFAEYELVKREMPVAEKQRYRFEVRGPSLTLFINGGKVVEIKDNTMLDPGEVGIWCRDTQIIVYSFKVEAL